MAVIALVVGVGLGAGGVLVAPWVAARLDPPEYMFGVNIFLRAGVTDAQRDEVRAGLAGIDGVRYESREQAYENFKELYKDSPDLVDSVKPDTLPESFRFERRGTETEFDCGLIAPVKDLSAVDDISVTRFSRDDEKSPMKEVHCP